MSMTVIVERAEVSVKETDVKRPRVSVSSDSSVGVPGIQVDVMDLWDAAAIRERDALLNKGQLWVLVPTLMEPDVRELPAWPESPIPKGSEMMQIEQRAQGEALKHLHPRA